MKYDKGRPSQEGGNDSDRSTEAERRLWSYFDSYKYSGKGDACTRPELDTFNHISDERKERDDALVEKRKNRPGLRQQREGGPDAFAFENFLTAHMIRCEWFGGKTSVTTEYDDWISGVDAVIEWPSTIEGGEPVRMAIDFTATERTEVFVSKSNKLEGNVRVKYLSSSVETNEDGSQKQLTSVMPLVLLGFDDSVYREIAERDEEIGPEHPLRVYLLQQASAQIDLQIILLTQKAFESARARRNEEAKEVVNLIAQKGDDLTAQEILDLMGHFDDETMNEVMSKRNRSRFEDLARIRNALEIALARTKDIQINDYWKNLMALSSTHQVLSSRN